MTNLTNSSESLLKSFSGRPTLNSPINHRFLEVDQNTSPAVLILLNANGAPVAFNRAARQYFQVSESMQWSDILHQSECDRWSEQIRSSLEKQIPISGWFLLRRFDNAFRQFVLRAEPRYDNNGEFFGHHISGLDITDIAPVSISANESTRLASQSMGSRLSQERRALAKEWHDALVNEATVVGVSSDVLLELVKSQFGESEIFDIAQRVKKSAASICEQLTRLDQLAREA